MCIRRTLLLCVVCSLWLRINTQPSPAPSPTEPIVFTGGIISVTEDESCDDIYTDVDSLGGTDGGTLNCNKASVLVLQVPLVYTPTEGGAFTYRFSPNGQSGGGQYTADESLCEEKGPGYCLFGRPFDVLVTVSKVVSAFELQEIGIAAPFGYLYENCLSKAPADDTGYDPYYSDASCGPADIWDEQDYRECNTDFGFPYFYKDNTALTPDPTAYSKCLFMCGWEIRKKTAELQEKGIDFTEWCNENDQVIYVTDSYVQDPTEANQLGCARADAWKNSIDLQKKLPNFPMPTGFCPCVNSATKHTTDQFINGQWVTTEDPPLASIVACKSCAGAGSCGTALPPPQPQLTSDCDLDSNYPDRDTVCECVPNADFVPIPGDTDTGTEARNDPQTVCFNTGQVHRCLKCQFQLHKGTTPTFEECAYTDLNEWAFCENYWSDICGSGEYGLGGRLPETGSDNNVAAVGYCNCMGVFIERSYWVSPICAPYRIQNPAKPRYAITVELVPVGDITGNSGIPVPGGTMTVGAGWAPYDANNSQATLSWINGTIDGFAVTEILSEYTKSGGYSSNIQGNIVMCNNANGDNAFCGMSTTDNPNDRLVPNANIFVTSDKMGLENPWLVYNESMTAKVPLADYIFKALGNESAQNAELARTNNTWWYYLAQSEVDTFGLGCGQNGWTMNGAADVGTTTTMCAGPQGTCIPGIDRRLRGEAVQPPCDIAVDFLNYIDTNDGKKTADTIVPPHVPPGWTPDNPTFYVDRGELRWTNDPLIENGNANVRLRISIAADFNGVEVAQSNGAVEAETCFIATQNLVGVFTVIATNLGNQPSEFIFTQGPECTPGLSVPPYKITLDKGATTVYVPIQGSAEYSAATAANQFCSISIAPSLFEGTNKVTGSTAKTQCTAQYSLAVIVPIASAHVTYTEQVADTFFTNYHNDPDCTGFLCGWIHDWLHGGFLKSFFVWVFNIVIVFLLTALIALCLLVSAKNVNDITQEQLGQMEGMKTEIKNLNADSFIK